MKTKEQIVKYTSQCRFQHYDWQEVLSYCREHFGGGRVHKALKPLSESTYQQFLDWIDHGYGVGDIVRYGHTVGILGACTPDYACLAVYLSFDKELIEDKLEIPVWKIVKATDKDIEEIQEKLRISDLMFSVPLACLMKRYAPQKGDIVRITIKDTITTGIYHNRDNADWKFYAYVQNGKVLKDYTLPAGTAIVSKPTKTDVERLQIALAQNQLAWSARNNALRKVEKARAEKRGRYWYLAEDFSITSDVDMYTKKHNIRHKNGNYFCIYGTAVLFSQKVRELRKEIAGTE